MATVTIDVAPRAGGQLLVALGMATPYHGRPVPEIVGGVWKYIEDPNDADQGAYLVTGTEQPIRITYRFTGAGTDYPEAMFRPRDSRFTRAADSLIEDAEGLRGATDVTYAVVNHVSSLFAYGHPDTRFYEDHDHIPQLCSLTEGSCVDINAYLIASLRAAGVEAGYIAGVFFPAEKIDADGNGWATDMHCWVVTRDGFGVREWDIAHHKKLGLETVEAALDPKPGRRFALSHSMGLDFPSAGLQDLKLISEPMWVVGGRCEAADNTIRLAP